MKIIKAKYSILPLLKMIFIATSALICAFPEPIPRISSSSVKKSELSKDGKSIGYGYHGKIIRKTKNSVSIGEILRQDTYLLYMWVVIWSFIILLQLNKLINRTALIASPTGIWIRFYGFIPWNAITKISYKEKRVWRGHRQFIKILITEPFDHIKPLVMDDKISQWILLNTPSEIKVIHINKDLVQLVSIA